MADTVAQQQIRAFVERILRLKEEARAINDDVKEVYAEAKGNGFDKTVLGKLVNYVEKRAKSEDTVREQEALFDLYLAAYDGHAPDEEDRPSHTHAYAYAREALPEHDPSTGEIMEDTAETPTTKREGQPGPHGLSAAPQHSGEEANDPVLTPGEHGEVSEPSGNSGEFTEPQPTAAQTGGSSSAPTSVAGPEAVESPAAKSEPARREATALGAPVDRSGGSEPPAHDPAPVQLDRTQPAPWCADPEDCGGASWTHTCGACLRARAQSDAARVMHG